MISNITSGMMLNMYRYGSPSKQVDNRQVFASVSIMVGGDGTSISKSQLKNYIDKASMGAVKISRPQLQALKTMYSSWNDLFGEDTDTISVNDLEKAPQLFYQVAISSNEENDNEKFLRELSEKAEKYKKEFAEKLNGNEDKTPTVEQLHEYLKELINMDKNDEKAEEIAYVINIMEDMKNPQNVYEV